MNITIGSHLARQAAQKGIDLNVVRAVLSNPAITYPSFTKDDKGKRVPRCCRIHGKQQEKWTGTAFGTKVCVVVDVCCQMAVTVWLDQVETAVRPDQRQDGVKGYTGRDGKWRDA